ncbi:MAG: choice-of-anchor D domain-containing protein [Solirubrobacterales bacterium]
MLGLPATSQAAEASASLSPSPQTFPSVIVGKSDTRQQFVLTNHGPESITVEGVSVTGPDSNDFALENDGCTAATLSPEESCGLFVTFTPSESGLREAELAIASSAENSPASAALSGRGLVQALTVSPSPLKFPATTVDNSSEREVTVANESEAEVAIYGVNIEGAGSSAFNTNGSDCGPSLSPGNSCKISIRFSPGSEGEERAFLHVRSEGTPAEQIIELFGVAAPPVLSFEPESYEFGLQSVKEGGAQTTMQLRNSGEGPVQVSLEIAGSESNDFNIGSSDCYGSTIAPKETCSIQVQFNPNQPGFHVAQVRARANNGATFAAEVSGTGGQAVLNGSPNPVSFGETALGGGVTRTITLTNSGDLPGGFFIALISGGDAGSFQLLEENCTTARLEPDGSCTALLRFQPESPGPKSAKLAFVGGEEGVVQVELNGLGVAPRLTLSPSGHDFGSQIKNSVGRAQIFTLTNEGKTPAVLGAASITGANSDQFRLSTDTCTAAELAPGGACELGARFAPNGAGARTATLRLGTAPEALTASLSGTGVQPPSNVFKFGKLKTDSKQGTATQSVTVPGQGKLILTGHNVKTTKGIASQKGDVSLSIVLVGKTKSSLKKNGAATVKVAVKFTPTGGASRTQNRTVRLFK